MGEAAAGGDRHGKGEAVVEDRRTRRAGAADSVKHGDASRRAGSHAALHVQSRIDGADDPGTDDAGAEQGAGRTAEEVRFASEGAMYGALTAFLYLHHAPSQLPLYVSSYFELRFLSVSLTFFFNSLFFLKATFNH